MKTSQTLGVAIVRFFVCCHVVVLGALAFFYLPRDLRPYVDVVAFASIGALVLLVFFLLSLGLFRDADGVPEGRLRSANKLTLIRFGLVVPLILTILHERFGLALALYVVCCATDVVDGVVARRNREQTQFGVIMDPLADILSTAGVFAALCVKDLVPPWVLVILAIRYASLMVGSAVLFFAVGPIKFKATPTGKIVGVLQAAVAILIIGLTAAGVDWQKDIGSILYPFLGMIFGSVIISQLVIGIRHVKEGAANAGS
ncbi:MAG: CDP-alcohol phosphatidyltransferase family protein [Candidatus Latescibacterota bacterium]|nr:MAG: CDP-alcohol phosphatidyltransferase family protein [Candidatus Latescibacterota bacterium]